MAEFDSKPSSRGVNGNFLESCIQCALDISKMLESKNDLAGDHRDPYGIIPCCLRCMGTLAEVQQHVSFLAKTVIDIAALYKFTRIISMSSTK